MDTMTRTAETRTMEKTGQDRPAAMMARPGSARMRDLTPAQRRAVMFAQQQVIAARAAKKAKDERQAALTRMWRQADGELDAETTASTRSQNVAGASHELSLREAIGQVLRELRTGDRKTLREVSEKAGVSLGYLSEVERGQKEASSELLSSIAESLGVGTPQMLRMVADRLEAAGAR
ncbi:XRE family transcriptional regulator [Bifidobacterium samirii]|uniref:XRE family transcriptional regulator n=2 Tax=Bifidobacterium samirii TaxID=2306974 RepID=A0A430FEK3_9BIFI|nr:XRE family transcriptional regulator [Bifidobacterium samirii]